MAFNIFAEQQKFIGFSMPMLHGCQYLKKA